MPLRQQLVNETPNSGYECLTGFLGGSLFDIRMSASIGGAISMLKSLVLVVGLLFLALAPGSAEAQTGQGNLGLISPSPDQGNQGLLNPRLQSLRPTQSPCSASSQSVRVCTSDFQSCSSACTASTLSDPIAGAQGCSQRCCNNLQACLSIRGCGNLTSNDCFTPTNPAVRALRQ